MKPDSNNTGSVESIPKMDNLNVKNNQETTSLLGSEAQPAVGSSSQVPSQTQPIKTAPVVKSVPSSKDDNTDNAYEQQISQIPAEDAEVIEKEWIDQVDKIVDSTSRDPYFEDQGHHALSRAYLKKRFNLDIN